MNQRCIIAAHVLIALFALFVVLSQLTDFSPPRYGMGSVPLLPKKWEALSHITNIVDRDEAVHASAGSDRYLDLTLPKNVRVFMTGILGDTNGARSGNYYYLTYYLFPRDIGASIGEPAHFTKNGMEGRAATSDEEILTNGYDVRVELTADATIHPKMLHAFPLNQPANPPWFNSWRDFVIAFFLPLLTALSGVWLLRWMFPNLELSWPETLAGSFGLGMMAVAALTLAMKLCGFHGRGVVLVLVAIGSVAELWRDRKMLSQNFFDSKRIIHRPVALIAIVAAGIIFVFLFRLAGLQGLMEFDAVANWAFKAKIFYLCTGHEIIRWFSNPALAYAHMDYPTLVPSLHAATYDSIGHVNEFVTKFWPTWMLLFLLAALASLNARTKSVPLYFLLALLLLPMTLTYAQMEGGTMPMIFFVTLGVVQCGMWIIEKNPARLALGLTLLFGAAMAKLEGFIFLAVTIVWIFLLPASRPSLKLFSNSWRAGIFCLLSALPFICLRAQIPALHFESHWAHDAAGNPIATLSAVPKVFLMVLARLFVNPNFANWDEENGHFHWIGKWDGASSLIDHFGLGWICILFSILICFCNPSRRAAVFWIFAVFISAVAALSIVLASFVSVTGIEEVLSQRAAAGGSGRYLFPMLWAWAAMLLTICFFRAEEIPEKNHFQ
jgi:hypothetical protein